MYKHRQFKRKEKEGERIIIPTQPNENWNSYITIQKQTLLKNMKDKEEYSTKNEGSILQEEIIMLDVCGTNNKRLENNFR